jgi:DNA-binding response OmpR family regulator
LLPRPFDDYITKPVARQELLAAVGRLQRTDNSCLSAQDRAPGAGERHRVT